MDSAGKKTFRDFISNNPIWGKTADILSQTLFPRAVKPSIGIARHARFILWALVNNAKVLISLPRHHGKSTYVTFLYVMWCILTRKKKFILILSSTGTQSIKFLARIRYYLTSKKVRNHYGDLSRAGAVVDQGNSYSDYVDPQTKQRSKIWNYKEVLIEAWGIRIVATSISSANRGLLNIDDRPDLIIFDDIEDRKNTNTIELRDRLSDAIVEEIFPAGAIDCQYIFIGTICHYGSFLIKLRSADGWFFIPFTRGTDTIENIKEFNKLLPDDFPDEYRFDPKQEYFTRDFKGLDGNFYKVGDKTPEVSLWQERYNYEYFCSKLSEYGSLGKVLSFWQEFFNQPKSNQWKVFNEFRVEQNISLTKRHKELILESTGSFIFPNGKKYTNVYSFCGGDLAESKNLHADWTVFTRVFTDSEGFVYVFPQYRIKEPNPIILAEYILNWHKVNKFQSASFDGQNFQQWFGKVLKYLVSQTLDDKGNKIYKKLKVHQRPRSNSKEDVIYSTLSPYMRDERVIFCGESEEFKVLFNELKKLGFNDTDDAADSLTYAFSNLKFPDEIDFDTASPISSGIQYNWYDELKEEEIWYYA